MNDSAAVGVGRKLLHIVPLAHESIDDEFELGDEELGVFGILLALWGGGGGGGGGMSCSLMDRKVEEEEAVRMRCTHLRTCPLD